MIDLKELKLKKKAVLVALEQNLGVVTSACRAAGLGRTTFYKWLKTDEDFNKSVKELENVQLDYAESKLLENIRANKETSIIFYLKCKGKKRGFVERNELDVTTGGEAINKIKIEIVKTKDD
jgi:hypothetical protein|tara:strand:- start:7386 stop:7751 length:366 start_codon:yes stop_codon:yes gene_type:complete